MTAQAVETLSPVDTPVPTKWETSTGTTIEAINLDGKAVFKVKDKYGYLVHNPAPRSKNGFFRSPEELEKVVDLLDMAEVPTRKDEARGPEAPEAPQATGRKSLYSDFTAAGLSPAHAERAEAVLDTLYAQYGTSVTGVRGVTDDAQSAEGGGRLIAFLDDDAVLNINPAAFQDAAELQAGHDMGWSIFSDFEGLLAHEFGHLLDHHVFPPGIEDENHLRIVKQRLKRKIANEYFGGDVELLNGAMSAVSGYAGKNSGERHAELFAFYKTGGARRPEWVIAWGKQYDAMWHGDLMGPSPGGQSGVARPTPSNSTPGAEERLQALLNDEARGKGKKKREHGNKGRSAPPATGTADDPIDVQGDLARAVELLHEGKHVRLNQPEEAATVLGTLARLVNEAEAQGREAHQIDMCQVSIAGTNLFCFEHQNMPRVKMPQLKGTAIPGSPADALERDDRGRVNLEKAFKEHLKSLGVSVKKKTMPASRLRASQEEINAQRLIEQMAKIRARDAMGKKSKRIFVTRDGYIVDGHHRWAGRVGLDVQDGKLGDVDMDVYVIDMDIAETLQLANDWTAEQGIAPAGFGQDEMKGFDTDVLEDDPDLSVRDEARGPSLIRGRDGSQIADTMPFKLTPNPDHSQHLLPPDRFQLSSKQIAELLSDPRVAKLFEDKRAEVIEKIRNGVPTISVSPAVLEKVLADGKVKNWFEKGRLVGWDRIKNYTDMREKYEKNNLGIPADTPVEDRPISGWIDSGSDSAKNTIDPYFGNVRIELKESVKGRTTVAMDDSMDNRLQPIKVTDLTTASMEDFIRAGFGPAAFYLRLLEARKTNAQPDDEHTFPDSYLSPEFDPISKLLPREYKPLYGDVEMIDPFDADPEIQVYGGVQLGDIERVTFSSRPSPQIRKRLKELGIEWSIR